jgi:acyl CoA:acetate/3-ketoacid CoA transferase alpha subunit
MHPRPRQRRLWGFTHLTPFAARHEVIRQGRKRLTLYRMTPDLIYDQPIARDKIAREQRQERARKAHAG